MNLLQEVENSILWLSIENENAKENLIKQAKHAKIDPNRIIFAAREKEWTDHLNRLRLIDLFLDTPNYNAHTTATDALSVGVPVLTLVGKTFAGRVAGSQLHTLGLANLITNSTHEYQMIALEMARKPELLERTKKLLESQLSISPLFNCKQYTLNLESTLKLMLDHKIMANSSGAI